MTGREVGRVTVLLLGKSGEELGRSRKVVWKRQVLGDEIVRKKLISSGK